MEQEGLGGADDTTPSILLQGAAAAYMTMAAGGGLAAAAAVAASPAVARLAQEAAKEIDSVWRQVQSWRYLSLAQFLVTASDHLHTTPEQVVSIAAESEEGRELYAAGVAAALDTINLRKARAFGRAVADGLLDDQASTSEELLALKALADLETPHIRALGRLIADYAGRRFDGSEIAEAAQISHANVTAITATLERHGLIEQSRGRERAAAARQLRDALDDTVRTERDAMRAASRGGVGNRKSPTISAVSVGTEWRLTGFASTVWAHLDEPTAEADSTA